MADTCSLNSKKTSAGKILLFAIGALVIVYVVLAFTRTPAPAASSLLATQQPVVQFAPTQQSEEADFEAMDLEQGEGAPINTFSANPALRRVNERLSADEARALMPNRNADVLGQQLTTDFEPFESEFDYELENLIEARLGERHLGKRFVQPVITCNSQAGPKPPLGNLDVTAVQPFNQSSQSLDAVLQQRLAQQ